MPLDVVDILRVCYVMFLHKLFSHTHYGSICKLYLDVCSNSFAKTTVCQWSFTVCNFTRSVVFRK